MGKLLAAIRSSARTWTSDLKDRGIRVNVVSPGMPLTPAMQSYLHANDGIEAGFNNMTPFGRSGEGMKWLQRCGSWPLTNVDSLPVKRYSWTAALWRSDAPS